MILQHLSQEDRADKTFCNPYKANVEQSRSIDWFLYDRNI